MQRARRSWTKAGAAQLHHTAHSRVCTAVVVVLTLTHTIKSVVTGQVPVTLEWKYAQGKTLTPTVVHVYVLL